jgi:hypothetical protein
MTMPATAVGRNGVATLSQQSAGNVKNSQQVIGR